MTDIEKIESYIARHNVDSNYKMDIIFINDNIYHKSIICKCFDTFLIFTVSSSKEVVSVIITTEMLDIIKKHQTNLTN